MCCLARPGLAVGLPDLGRSCWAGASRHAYPAALRPGCALAHAPQAAASPKDTPRCRRRPPEQLPHVLRHRQRGDAVKHAQRVALVQQLLHVALVQRAGHDQHNVVDHVPVRAEVHELRQRVVRLRGAAGRRAGGGCAGAAGRPAGAWVRGWVGVPGGGGTQQRPSLRPPASACSSSPPPASACTSPRWWPCTEARPRSRGAPRSRTPSAAGGGAIRSAEQGSAHNAAASQHRWGEGGGGGRGAAACCARDAPPPPRAAHQVELDVFEGLALAEVVVFCHGQQTALVAPHDGLCGSTAPPVQRALGGAARRRDGGATPHPGSHPSC
jgi:hypothetical protein